MKPVKKNDVSRYRKQHDGTSNLARTGTHVAILHIIFRSFYRILFGIIAPHPSPSRSPHGWIYISW